MVLLSGFVYRADCTAKAEHLLSSDGISITILHFNEQKNYRISKLKNQNLHKESQNEIILSIPTLFQ